ncbi:lytic transglycosylase domain-containing protein [Pseudoruegeria sp. HB172150]|uniref:lytic transglycosylase domain-containing protein n=1 Tax=Pseudoruegeria sp. HB172150 TaxID=2721164 RepID=UPI0015535459|nr:lytic transglycosylase domain-containing protein [Pseudoruegeria sp. HB172150]
MRQAVSAALIIMAAFCAPGTAGAEPPPFAEFTFKRVKPPAPGTTNRINIQIEPQPEPPKPEPEAEAEPKPPVEGAYAWYWDKVRPEMSEAGPGRLESALNELTKGPGVPTPRLASMQAIAQAYGRDILAATVGTKVSPALVLAVIGIESSGRSNAVSPKGATGLMQLIPDTAARFGVTNSTDPAQNIKGGVAYLDWLMGEFGNDPILVLAGYNAGEGAVWKHSGVPPYDETRAYVPKVLAAWTVARGLCMTPPVLISDGCAFAVSGVRTDG